MVEPSLLIKLLRGILDLLRIAGLGQQGNDPLAPHVVGIRYALQRIARHYSGDHLGPRERHTERRHGGAERRHGGRQLCVSSRDCGLAVSRRTTAGRWATSGCRRQDARPSALWSASRQNGVGKSATQPEHELKLLVIQFGAGSLLLRQAGLRAEQSSLRLRLTDAGLRLLALRELEQCAKRIGRRDV